MTTPLPATKCEICGRDVAAGEGYQFLIPSRRADGQATRVETCTRCGDAVGAFDAATKIARKKERAYATR